MSSKIIYQAKEIAQWEWPEVKQWLTDNNFSNAITKLEPHLITGYDLFYLTQDQMKAFDISSFQEINRLNRSIHSEVLKYLRITFTYETTSYSYQLDFEPNLTVESMSNTIALSLQIKDRLLFISTQDNRILFPHIKIIELILIEPDIYRNLKIFNSKESVSMMNNYSFTPNANISSNAFKQATHNPISNIATTLLQQGTTATTTVATSNPLNSNANPLSTMPIMPSALSLKYKSNFEEYRAEKQEIESSNKSKDKKTNEDIIPISSTNNDLGSKPELSFKSKYENDNKPSAYMQYKMNQKQQQPNTLIDDPKLNSNFYNKKLATNQLNSFSNTNPNMQQQQDLNIKEAKDSIELNNPTSNYIFNSGELLTYDQIKKNQGKNTFPASNQGQYSSIPQGNSNKDEIMTINKDSYQKYKAYPSLNNEMPLMNKDKDDYRRFSSEKRNFRTYGNFSSPPQEEEYQPKGYEKIDKFNNNNAPIDDFNDKYNNEKFNRFSSRQHQSSTQGQGQSQSQTQIPNQKQSETSQLPSYGSNQLNYDMKSNKKAPSNIRNNQFDNFNLERKPYLHQIPIQTTSDENDNFNDSNNQISQEKIS